MHKGIRFLVASDVHLGHKERHPVCFNDSVEALQEVLEKAREQDVDFLLLGGDLFDEVNPSIQSFYHFLSAVKKASEGGSPPRIQASMNG